MIAAGQDRIASEAPDGSKDPVVVGGHQNALDAAGLLHAPVDVLNQRFAANFDEGLSRETGGFKTGRDNRDGALGIHTPHTGESFQYITRTADSWHAPADSTGPLPTAHSEKTEGPFR